MSKVILVTGGNRGIGLEICRQLATLGHQILMGSRNLQKGLKVAESLPEGVIVKNLDVSDEREIRVLQEQIEKEFGHLDCLINNAGIIGQTSQGAGTASITEIKSIMDVNLFGAWQMVQYMIPLLQKSVDPRIVNISSGMGAWADLSGGYAGYRISKTSLNAVTVLLANELAGSIKVNAMCPGWVKTDMGGSGASREVDQGADTAVWLATEERIPHGKFLRDRKIIDW